MRGVDGDTEAGELILVHLVPATLGERFNEADDLDPRLQRVIPGDQSDVSSTDDE